MSYDVYLRQDGAAVTVPHFTDGGMHELGGTSRAWLNITYNYTPLFIGAWPEELDELDRQGGGLGRLLHGRTGAETGPLLREAVARLGTERDEDYWAATPGNAGHALSILSGWAEQHPDATWDVS